MTRFIAVVALVACLGAGCGKTADTKPSTPAAKRPTTGVGLVTAATDTGGQPISFTDAKGFWTLLSVLPPTLTDWTGTYKGPKDGEIVTVHLGVSGTPEKDRELMKGINTLQDFEIGSLDGWSLTAAYEPARERWVVRAVAKDTTGMPDAYHAIECLGVKRSENNFWDGCRTLIQHARIEHAKPIPASAIP